MKAITLRNLPPDLAKAVRREAERKRTSINKAVISLLESKADIQKKKKGRKPHHQELDALAGSWSKKEATAAWKRLPLFDVSRILETSKFPRKSARRATNTALFFYPFAFIL
jgi:hypothetical protein